MSDFIVFDLGSFPRAIVTDGAIGTGLFDYNAETGLIECAARATGLERQYGVTFGGFSSVHFDVYGFVSTGVNGDGTWEINPGSHDTTATAGVPEPATVIHLGAGLLVLGGLTRKFKR